MMINKEKHISLIEDELIFHTNEFEKLLIKQAAKMFVDNQLFLCRYQGFDEVRGNIIVKFDHKICSPPRKNENLQCFISSMQDENVRHWGGITYQDLRTTVTTQFESKTVFFSYENDYTIVGLSGVRLEDIPKYQKNALVFLAPQDPPLQYLFNLVNFLKQEKANYNRILNLEIEKPNWNPEHLIVNHDIVSKIQTDFIEDDLIIIQGPPGTGKTYLMAQICKALLKADYRILVTALTNRALIEVGEKEFLSEAMQQGKIYKSALTADESKNKKLNGLISFKSLKVQQPKMLLTTYYKMSHIAMQALEDDHFDYIIIEEASQAYLATIAMARKLGKKCIIIGDINQLEPIFHKDYGPEDENYYHWMICGLKALSFYLPTKQYILTESYRLTENAVKNTNLFYDGALKSKSTIDVPLNFTDFPKMNLALNPLGGSSMIKFNLPQGRLPSAECSEFIVGIIDEIKVYNKKSEIAVLAFNRDSVRFLQKEILGKCKFKDDILVETIDRIQGLTTDFCLFFVPNDSIPFSFQPNRFNVSTSRAKICTLIVADENLESFFPLLDPKVKNYLSDLQSVSYLNLTKPIGKKTEIIELESKFPQAKVEVKIVDKIDLSKLQKPKKEISLDKDNIYIIDTNVFVEYPEIIPKIDNKYKVILSAKVIDELDYLKFSLSGDQKNNVQNALRLINNCIGKREIKMETAAVELLPSDFNKNSPDNMILSVALKFRDENPILLTSDNGLQIKAKGLNIKTITLKEFLRQLRY